MSSPRIASELLRDASAALAADVSAGIGSDISNDAFAAAIAADEVPDALLADITSTAATNLRTSSDYKEIAVLGYAIWCGRIGDAYRELFRDSVLQLAGRSSFIDSTPMAFCTDGVAILGICLGARILDDPTVTNATTKWLDGFVHAVCAMPSVDRWQKAVLSIASGIVSQKDISQFLDTANIPSDVRFGLMGASVLPESELSDPDAEAFIASVRDWRSKIPFPLSVLRLCGLRWIYRTAPTVVPDRLTVEDTCRLLREFPAAFHRWCWEAKPRSKKKNAVAVKWQVQNEYHVQDLLYFMLRPIFPDLKDEENFPSVGHKHPRTDLYIPSLRLIIEVKFIYPTTTFPKITEEIGADSALYLAEKSRYDSIVVFVWDDSRRVEQHALLKSGLLSLDGIVDAVIVSRPGMMTDE